MKQLWVEKYRPQLVEEVLGQEAIVSEIKSQVDAGTMQHYLFYSPEPGTGKTSLAYAIAKELGWQLHRFNASSKKQRGIEFVEDDVAPLSRVGQWETLFLLDEADRITTQAQDALKGVIEDACGYFILTCNDLSRVSPWLKSRCQVRHFKPVEHEVIMSRLASIAALEGVEITEADCNAIATFHAGDLRNCIGALQSYSCLPEADRQAFIRSFYVPDIDCEKFLMLCFKEKAVDDALNLLSGTPREAVRTVFRYAINQPAKAESKLKVIDAAITSERDIINGVDPEMVLWNFCRMVSE